MQGRTEQAREGIVHAAALAFDTHGYAATSLSEIMALAGVDGNALYFHYGSKEAIAVEIVRRHYGRWPPLISRFEALGEPALETAAAISIAVGREFRDTPIVRAGVRLSTERYAVPVDLPAPFVGWTTVMSRLLAQAQTDGDIQTSMSADRLGGQAVAMFYGVQYVSNQLNARSDIDDRVYDMWFLLLTGMETARPAKLVLRRAQRMCERISGMRVSHTVPLAAWGDTCGGEWD
jgi:AcrR family transcriptional regulator